MSAILARRYFVRGRDEMGRGEYDAAVESFRAAVDLAPSFVSGRLGYAAALVRVGDMPRAAQALRAGLPRATSDGARAKLLIYLGDVLTAAGDFFGAEDAYRQSAELVPDSGAPPAGLARVHAKLGRYADAFASLLAASRAGR
jgi:tetratricopeptide (TPR) repeat protein